MANFSLGEEFWPLYASLGALLRACPGGQVSVRPRLGSTAPYCPAAPRQGQALPGGAPLRCPPLRASLDVAPRLGSNGMREPGGAGRTDPVAWTRRPDVALGWT
jgi:hypothetical protein